MSEFRDGGEIEYHIRRVKTIDEIYEEARGYGLVITNDMPLMTALNSRVDTPRIGPLAMTPHQIAAQLGPIILGRRLMSDLELIAAVSKETGFGFKQVYSEIMNIREIRSHTVNVKENLTTRNARLIYESYSGMPTLERAMAEFDVDDERVSWFFQRENGVAVIGIELFDDLDKHFNPLADEIDIFTDETFGIEEIREVGNDRQLAENAAALIDPENANDFAIVMNSTAPIADAVRAALYRSGIHFINSLNVRDLTRVRDYLGFLSLSLRYQTLRVRDVKETFSNFKGGFSIGLDSFLLNRQTPDVMWGRGEELTETMRGVYRRELTFAEVRDVLFEPRERPLITMLLDELNLTDETVTSTLVGEMRFAVDNVQNLKHNEQIPEEEKDGVLLADCKNSVFVDRPVVIFLGMEQEWNVPVAGRRYYDAEEESKLVALRLEALLQQGQRRVYMVNSNKGGKDARPTLTFDLVLGRKCDSFAAVCDGVTKGIWSAGTEEHMPERGETRLDPGREVERQFSKSSFNAYVACPRRYMFNELIRTPDEKSTEFGKLIHEFAELYMCYPDLVRERGIDQFVDMMSERYAGLSNPLLEDLDGERIRRAMINTAEYIDTLGAKPELDVPLGDRHQNRFMQSLGLTMTSDSCETDHRSEIHPVHGVFDLYWDGVITDYKTGKAKEAKEIAQNMNLDSITKEPEFQPLIYLNLSKESEGPKFEFRQFYAMGNDVASAREGFDITENVRTVELNRGDSFAYIRSSPEVRDALDASLKAAFNGKAEAMLAAIGDDAPRDPREWKNSPEVVERVRQALGPRVKTDEAVTALSKIDSIVVGGTVVVSNRVIVPAASIQTFIKRLDEMHSDMLSQITTTLPAKPAERIKCPKCPYYAACTAASVASPEEVDDDD